MISQYRWVCTICGDGFTRKSSAIRHNGNLHNGNSEIVRPLEYVIGRQDGTYHRPVDPLIFRRNKKRNIQHNNPPGNSAYAHESYEKSPDQYQNSNRFNAHRIQSTYPLLNPSMPVEHQLPFRNARYPDHQSSRIENMSKLEKLTELNRLLSLYYIEDVARTIFNAINIQVFNLGDESELDYQLRFLVEFEKGLTK